MKNMSHPLQSPSTTSDSATSTRSLLIQKSLLRAERLAKRLLKLEKRIQKYRAQLETTQNARLSVAGIFFLGLIAFTAWPTLGWELAWIAGFIGIFSWLVIRTRNLRRHVEDLVGLEAFVRRQRSRLLGHPSGRHWERASETAASQTLLHDLGLVGPHSLFSLIDETLTDFGETRLLQWITQPDLAINRVLDRQKQVRRLENENWFYTRLSLVANRQTDLRLSAGQVLEFIGRPFVGDKFQWFFAFNLILWLIMVAAIAVSLTQGTSSPVAFIIVFSMVSFWSLKQTESSFSKGVGLSHHLGQLEPLFVRIEKRSEQNALYRELLPVTSHSGPSREAKRLNFVLNFLGIQANPLLYIVINALTPWTLTASFFLERRRKRINESFPACLNELAQYEALSSLALMAHYQTSVFPDVTPQATPNFQLLFHPLVDRTRVVANDFAFPENKSLGLLTGSNMSGKSTFLRTIGINQILANMGAPVFADQFNTQPLAIETCIEVSDSLRDGFSYFYAEVRRLKDLLLHTQKGEPVLFLIDEIFRGTNNRERQIGSRAVIQTLAKSSHALGFVSTHDLELTNLEDSTPAVMNLHFREEIRGAQMYFTYKLHSGPCPTTNALKIMAAEGIAVDVGP